MARILIAEHNKTTMAYLKTTLKKAGHDVDAVDNCLDAWRATANAQHDVLLLDVVMPGIDTFVLAQRALQENPELCVIFITGFAGVAMDSFSEISYLAAPSTTQPFHLKDIAARVRYLLGHGNLPARTAPASGGGNVIYASFAAKDFAGQHAQQS